MQQQHLQQLQLKAKSQSLSKFDYVSLLRSKYQLPADQAASQTAAMPCDLSDRSREQLVEMSRSLQERLQMTEMMNELLINELAGLLAEKSPLASSHR